VHLTKPVVLKLLVALAIKMKCATVPLQFLTYVCVCLTVGKIIAVKSNYTTRKTRECTLPVKSQKKWANYWMLARTYVRSNHKDFWTSRLYSVISPIGCFHSLLSNKYYCYDYYSCTLTVLKSHYDYDHF